MILNFPFENELLEVTLKKTNELTLKDLVDPERRPQLLQLLNICLKQGLKSLSFEELGKSGKYFNVNEKKRLEEAELEVARGYSLTFVPLMR